MTLFEWLNNKRDRFFFLKKRLLCRRLFHLSLVGVQFLSFQKPQSRFATVSLTRIRGEPFEPASPNPLTPEKKKTVPRKPRGGWAGDTRAPRSHETLSLGSDKTSEAQSCNARLRKAGSARLGLGSGATGAEPAPPPGTWESAARAPASSPEGRLRCSAGALPSGPGQLKRGGRAAARSAGRPQGGRPHCQPLGAEARAEAGFLSFGRPCRRRCSCPRRRRRLDSRAARLPRSPALGRHVPGRGSRPRGRRGTR